jgi:hypothetical protein
VAKTKTKTKKKPADEIKIDRRMRSGDRRTVDRRTQDETVAVERRQSERRKVPRRRQIDPTTCERDYPAEEIEFMHAMDAYKRSSGRMFPTCSEILEVVRHLGYARVTADQSGEAFRSRLDDPVLVDRQSSDEEFGAAAADQTEE